MCEYVSRTATMPRAVHSCLDRLEQVEKVNASGIVDRAGAVPDVADLVWSGLAAVLRYGPPTGRGRRSTRPCGR